MDNYVYMLDGVPYINLTNRCCNHCTFCLRNNGSGIGGSTLWLEKEPTAQEVIELLDKLENPKEVVFCGYGEPTCRMDILPQIAQYLKSRGIATRLNTNGLGNLIAGEDIVPVLKGKIDAVSISLNEADAAGYDAVSRSDYGEAAFEAMLSFAKECVDAGIRTTMSVVDVIGEKKIAECRAIAERCGANFRVRAYIADNKGDR